MLGATGAHSPSSPLHTSFKRVLLAGSSLLLALALGEAAVRLVDADRRSVNRGLYYMTVDLPAHVPDPGFLQYRLQPGASLDDEGRWGPYQVSVGDLGDRSGGLPPQRRPCGLRIAMVGGSTVYGAEVSDGESLPTAFDAALRARGVDADVGNFGTSAYVTAQMAALGKELLAHDLDLLLLVHTNQGPRAFLMPDDLDAADHAAWFQAEPQRWLEHFPAPRLLPDALHLALLQTSALYRAAAPWLRGEPDRARPLTDRLAHQQLAELRAAAQAADVPLRILLWPEGWEGWPSDLPSDLPAGMALDLDTLDVPVELKVEHPPAEGLRWYGERLADLVLERGWLPPDAATPAPEDRDGRACE